MITHNFTLLTQLPVAFWFIDFQIFPRCTWIVAICKQT